MSATNKDTIKKLVKDIETYLNDNFLSYVRTGGLLIDDDMSVYTHWGDEILNHATCDKKTDRAKIYIHFHTPYDFLNDEWQNIWHNISELSKALYNKFKDRAEELGYMFEDDTILPEEYVESGVPTDYDGEFIIDEEIFAPLGLVAVSLYKKERYIESLKELAEINRRWAETQLRMRALERSKDFSQIPQISPEIELTFYPTDTPTIPTQYYVYKLFDEYNNSSYYGLTKVIFLEGHYEEEGYYLGENEQTLEEFLEELKTYILTKEELEGEVVVNIVGNTPTTTPTFVVDTEETEHSPSFASVVDTHNLYRQKLEDIFRQTSKE